MKKNLLIFAQDFSCTIKYLCSYYYYRNCLIPPSITVIIMFIVIVYSKPSLSCQPQVTLYLQNLLGLLHICLCHCQNSNLAIFQ